MGLTRMGLTVIIKQGQDAGSASETGSDLALNNAAPGDRDPTDLALHFDAPRIVLGRARACEVQLPDPTVSGRHASIRQRGTETVVVDEGSSNGTLVGEGRQYVKLPPQSPRVVRDGDLLRVGRVWLELRFTAAPPSSAADRAVVARSVLAARLREDGESPLPRARVVAGPDEGAELELIQDGRTHTVGRGDGCDLTLSDQKASRRHIAIEWQNGWVIYDLGSKQRATLDDQPLAAAPTPWKIGSHCTLADTTLALVDPVAEALDEAIAAPDEKMAPREFSELPRGISGNAVVVDAPETAPGDDDGSDGESAEEDEDDPGTHPERSEQLRNRRHSRAELEEAGPSRLVDVVVFLVAIGLLALSLAGLMWVLG